MSALFTAWTALALGVLPPGGAASASTVTGIQILPTTGMTELLVSVEGRVMTRDFTMEGPHRIVVDLLDTRIAPTLGNFEGIGRGGVQAIRMSQYAEDVVRIVVELDLPVGYTLLAGDGYVRVSMENPWGDFEPWESVATAVTAPGVTQVNTVTPVSTSVSAPPQRVPTQSSPIRGLFLADTAEPITISFQSTPIREVLFAFADFSGRFIVPSSAVAGTVNAEIRNQPWDIALHAILEAQNLAAQELGSGIIRVDRLQDLSSREEVEPLITRPFRVNYASAQELQPAIETLLSDRGRVALSASTNSLVVTDLARVLDAVEQLIGGLDLQTPEITISAKIIFVNRTDLQDFGVVYDLKDSRGNQLNVITPGGIDLDGDGRIVADEIVQVGENVVALGGNSLAALGNANQRVASASLQFMTSLILGRHSLVSFVEALQSVNLSDVQAAPQVRVMDNQQARILVGERTPIRVIDASGGGAGGQGGQFPQATVQIEETGIILEVTPHVTYGDLIRMELRAERSGIELADSDLGVRFNAQEATTSVLVADGETVVIGGLTVTERTEVRSGIPLLQELPLIGRFFRVTREQRIQRDLMILVTPQINRR